MLSVSTPAVRSWSNSVSKRNDFYCHNAHHIAGTYTTEGKRHRTRHNMVRTMKGRSITFWRHRCTQPDGQPCAKQVPLYMAIRPLSSLDEIIIVIGINRSRRAAILHDTNTIFTCTRPFIQQLKSTTKIIFNYRII